MGWYRSAESDNYVEMKRSDGAGEIGANAFKPSNALLPFIAKVYRRLVHRGHSSSFLTFPIVFSLIIT